MWQLALALLAERGRRLSSDGLEVSAMAAGQCWPSIAVDRVVKSQLGGASASVAACAGCVGFGCVGSGCGEHDRLAVGERCAGRLTAVGWCWWWMEELLARAAGWYARASSRGMS